nr:XRE family transcriptional regulator [uncultured Halomonas sp.]
MNAVRQLNGSASLAPSSKGKSRLDTRVDARDYVHDDVRDMEKRSRLMRVVTRRIAFSELDNREIARRAGIPTQRISDLLAGRLEHFSIDQLQALRETVEDDTPTS